ncbi:MAG: PfkB family carbohydrate kinase, partial [Thermodesulfobacteriota bacterium]|nr:PfkB family carbohydrate kinase [Thermodesulfobacteriota bacterium]
NTISGDTIKIIEDAFTAGAYITTDENNNQITCFNPGAMLYTSDFNFDSLHANDSIGIIAPGNLEDMLIYSRIYKEKRIDYIFDPGQSIPSWEKEQLMEMMSGSKVFISNEYELELIIGKIGLDNREILEKTEAVITTKGEHGSTIITHDRTIHIMAVKPRRVIDPTGAGDAYRAGLIKGLSEHNDLVYSAQLGAVSASFSVEEAGTQAYHFTMDEFTERFRETFS